MLVSHHSLNPAHQQFQKTTFLGPALCKQSLCEDTKWQGGDEADLVFSGPYIPVTPICVPG